MCIYWFHFWFLNTHFCPRILHGVVIILGERGADVSPIFFLPKNNILDTEMKMGKYRKGKEGSWENRRISIKDWFKPVVPLLRA